MTYDSDVAIQSIVFHPDGAFDITFAEQRDFNIRGTLVRNLMVPAGAVPESDIDTALDAIRELLDVDATVKVIATNAGGGRGRVDFLAVALAAGAAGTLAKPFGVSRFRRAVSELLGQGQESPVT